VIRTVEPPAIAWGDRHSEAEVTMVPTLLARVLDPVSSLFHRQIDAAQAMGEGVVTLTRSLTDTLGPGGTAALVAMVVVPVLVVVLATLTGAAKELAA
jgi:hypothetical protein